MLVRRMLVLLASVSFSVGCADSGPVDDDDDTSEDCEFKGCDDIDLSGYGTDVAWETLACDGQAMHDAPGGDTTPSGNYYFDTQDDLDALLQQELELDCPLDFGTYHVAGAVRHDASAGGDYIDICGIFEQDGGLNVVLFEHRYGSDPATQDYFTPYHLAAIPASEFMPTFHEFECSVFERL